MLVGIIMVVVSAVCIIPNIMIMTAIYKDKELFALNSYKFMLFLGFFDITQLIAHFITGFFNVFESVGDPVFAKSLGVIATPSYVCYVVITIVLAFNRFTQLAVPNVDEFLFGPGKLKFWISFCLLFYFAFAVALASPWATIQYVPDAWSWSYDYSLSGSKTVQQIEMVIELGGIGASFAIYSGVFVMLWRTLILPETLGTYLGLNFMWILNGAVNPIVYFLVNAAIRKKATMNFRSKTLTVRSVNTIRGHSQTAWTENISQLTVAPTAGTEVNLLSTRRTRRIFALAVK
ncbi:hypothetical protein L596_008695 [Steinernema carpocapsae]|nr:hypothetical protein L596_008695 [Steinernema carpocapsae]